MDWTYKHFRQEAVFNAPVHEVLEAARSVLAEAFGPPEETSEGFTAQGFSGLHPATVTVHVASAVAGTQVTVELQVKRLAAFGYMLWDVGGFYNGRIDNWFRAIGERLGGSDEQRLVSKTTTGNAIQRGCLAGCLLWVFAGACLGVGGVALDRAIFPELSSSSQGPFSLAGSLIALLLGILAFFYVAYPEGSVAMYLKRHVERTGRDQNQ